MSSTVQIESRLFDGARLIKTMDADAAKGVTWAFEDGRMARADLCQKMLEDGVIAPRGRRAVPRPWPDFPSRTLSEAAGGLRVRAVRT